MTYADGEKILEFYYLILDIEESDISSINIIKVIFALRKIIYMKKSK